MADVFDWIRPGYELVTVKFEWNVVVPYLQTADGNGETLESHVFSSRTNPKSKWQLQVEDDEHVINIYACHCDPSGIHHVKCREPVMLKLAILDRNRRKLIQDLFPSSPNSFGVKCQFSKESLVNSKCIQQDGSFTFCCKIFTHVKIVPVSSAFDCSNRLSTHLGGLFNSMQFSDVIFIVRGCEFPSHKNILAARSEVFAAMFQHPMNENFTNQIKIEDIEPDVFQELLRFIYTGRVQDDKLEVMAARLFIAADKYLMDDLKDECENYLLHHMSPENCVVLLLTGDLQNPTELLKEAAIFFRRLPSEVMATGRWATIEKENTRLLCQIQKFLLIKK